MRVVTMALEVYWREHIARVLQVEEGERVARMSWYPGRGVVRSAADHE
jgi:hypothetical protein